MSKIKWLPVFYSIVLLLFIFFSLLSIVAENVRIFLTDLSFFLKILQNHGGIQRKNVFKNYRS